MEYDIGKIKNGTPAIYNSDGHQREIIIRNVQAVKGAVLFEADDRYTGYPVKRLGETVRWNAEFALKSKTIIIDGVNSEADLSDGYKNKLASAKRFFADSVTLNGSPFTLDDEQWAAVLSDKHTLVTARAGSGKTRVLVAKLIYLLEKGNCDDENVLAFCFNKDAAEEINARLKNACKIDGENKYEDYEVAQTFHSFAKQSQDACKVLADEQKKLVKQIVGQLRIEDKSFDGDVYEFFKDATLYVEKRHFANVESYYKFVKNSRYLTLNGEHVKSNAEKVIADYLFEHNIRYFYESGFYPNRISFENSRLTNEERDKYRELVGDKKMTMPDFYLCDYKLVWEHWAAVGDETAEEIDNFNKSVGDYNQYIENKLWKQSFWQSDWRKKLSNGDYHHNCIKSVNGMIETDCKSFFNLSRGEQEEKIERLLASFGVVSEKLPREEIIRRVWAKAIDAFTNLMVQFVVKMQQTYFDDELEFLAKADSVCDIRSKAYYKLGYKVYKKYVEILSSRSNVDSFAAYNNYDCDFSRLVYDCCLSIRSGKLDEKIKKLKWIFVDEYQDFSRLFDYMISSVLERNPEIKLFCVGDDWQAINRFAGSDISYFKNFKNKYEDGKLLNMSVNYRSGSHIVSFANRFMEKFGIGGKPAKSCSLNTGDRREIDITKQYIGKMDVDNPYCKYPYNASLRYAQCLKVCSDIIKSHKKDKIFIITRKTVLMGSDIDYFSNALKKVCAETGCVESETDYNDRVTVKTAHKSKGEEADVVIVLNLGDFPLIHPDSGLFSAFGQTKEDAFDDEVRLYYVAVTRAKKSLYVCYSGDKKSQFIFTSGRNDVD